MFGSNSIRTACGPSRSGDCTTSTCAPRWPGRDGAQCRQPRTVAVSGRRDLPAGLGNARLPPRELMMHGPYAARAALRNAIAGGVSRCAAIDPGRPDVLTARWVLMPPFGFLPRGKHCFTWRRGRQPGLIDFPDRERALTCRCIGRGTEAATAGAASSIHSIPCDGPA